MTPLLIPYYCLILLYLTMRKSSTLRTALPSSPDIDPDPFARWDYGHHDPPLEPISTELYELAWETQRSLYLHSQSSTTETNRSKPSDEWRPPPSPSIAHKEWHSTPFGSSFPPSRHPSSLISSPSYPTHHHRIDRFARVRTRSISNKRSSSSDSDRTIRPSHSATPSRMREASTPERPHDGKLGPTTEPIHRSPHHYHLPTVRGDGLKHPASATVHHGEPVLDKGQRRTGKERRSGKRDCETLRVHGRVLGAKIALPASYPQSQA